MLSVADIGMLAEAGRGGAGAKPQALNMSLAAAIQWTYFRTIAINSPLLGPVLCAEPGLLQIYIP